MFYKTALDESLQVYSHNRLHFLELKYLISVAISLSVFAAGK